jgi:hypothetical protein
MSCLSNAPAKSFLCLLGTQKKGLGQKGVIPIGQSSLGHTRPFGVRYDVSTGLALLGPPPFLLPSLFTGAEVGLGVELSGTMCLACTRALGLSPSTK